MSLHAMRSVRRHLARAKQDANIISLEYKVGRLEKELQQWHSWWYGNDNSFVQRMNAISASVAVHQDDCRELGFPVHHAAKAAALIGGPHIKDKLRIHKRAGLAKHADLHSDDPFEDPVVSCRSADVVGGCTNEVATMASTTSPVNDAATASLDPAASQPDGDQPEVVPGAPAFAVVNDAVATTDATDLLDFLDAEITSLTVMVTSVLKDARAMGISGNGKSQMVRDRISQLRAMRSVLLARLRDGPIMMEELKDMLKQCGICTGDAAFFVVPG